MTDAWTFIVKASAWVHAEQLWIGHERSNYLNWAEQDNELLREGMFKCNSH